MTDQTAKRCKKCGACQECGAQQQVPQIVPVPYPYPYPVAPYTQPRPYWYGPTYTTCGTATSGVSGTVSGTSLQSH